MTPRRGLSWALAALAFALPLSIAGTNAALVATSVLLLWLLATPAGRRDAASALPQAARSPVFLAIAAYAAWGLVASLCAVDAAASLRLWPKDAHRLWALAVIAGALAFADEAPVARPLAAGLALHAGVGVWQAVRDWSAGVERVRAHGFLHPVSYADLLGLGILGAAAALARPDASARKHRRPIAGLLALVGVALVASQTRAVVFALAAAFAAACVLEARWRRHALAAALVVVGVFAFWEIMPTNGRNIRNLFSSSPGTSAHRARFVLWEVALDIVREHPATGVGPGGFRAAFERHHPEKLDGEGSWGNAHNLFLHQLAERGVPGLLVLFGLFAAFAMGALRAERRRRDAWSLWAATATAAFLVMNLTEVSWQTEQVATLFLFLWLLGAGPRPSREIL